MPAAYLAIDLGASSGRAILGVLEGEPVRLRLEEVHRFEHTSCPTPAGPVWDLTGIWLNLLEGLRKATGWCRDNGVELQSIGVDTWGVDWALVGESGELLLLPHCYRDPQNDAACERVVETLGGFERLYERTGIQKMPFNTLFQVAARHAAEPRLFDAAKRLLFLPDLLHFWLSGQMATERTIASTSSMLDVQSGDWDRPLLEELGLPTTMLGPIVEPGTTLGVLRDEVAESVSASPGVRVVVPASHDTASAIAAAPATEDRAWAYLSSGTWSLLGAELPHPITSPAARLAPFTNERGVGNTIRFLQNISGLWLVQELRRDLSALGEELSHGSLAELAEHAEPFRTLVNPNHKPFAKPGDMAEKIRRFARDSKQPVPETAGQLVRCCLESLALSYRYAIDQIEPILGHRIERLHVIGGGTQNALLNQMTAAAVERPITCGPVEATAVGNVLVQAMGCGELSGLQGIREVVRRSFDLEQPSPSEPVSLQTYQRYQILIHGA